MILPFRNAFRLTQEFGVNRDSYIRFGMQGHNGLDYALPTGTQIIAPHAGKVLETSFDAYGYGNYIKIESATEGSVLAHLQSFQVKVGDIVSEGQPIGISNNTGNSTGPHLHWGYYRIPRNRQNGFAGYINQLPMITAPKPPPTPIPVPLETPNPGYAPSHEGQTVESGGVVYRSYKDTGGKLVWQIVPKEDFKAKYEVEVGKTRQLQSQVADLSSQVTQLETKIQTARVALS